MASPQLAIAKVSFSAVLLRPDPVSCPRAEIDEFLGQLDVTLLRCSPANVQKSKQWILNHVVQSTNRVAALGKYLTALAHSFNVDIAATRQAREPSSKRKRLHILYVLNDLLYHICVRQREDGFSSQLESFLPALAQSAAAFPDCPRHAKKVADLVDLWGEQGYFSKAFIVQLQDAIRDAPTLDPSSVANGSIPRANITGGKISKDVPFVMPAMHGDVTAPWYDLPAANWLPVIEPNSIRPMNPSMIKPLQFMSGPADKSLVEAVQNLLGEVDRIYAKDRCLGDDPAESVDMLGQRVIHDELTGEVIDGETYYGWSRKFCQKMKQRRKKGNGSEEDGRGRSGEGRIPEARAEAGVGIGLDDEAIAEIEFGDGPTADHARHLCEETDATHAHVYTNSTSQPPFPPVPAGANFSFDASPPPRPPNWQGPWPPPPPPPPSAGSNWMSSVSLPVPSPMNSDWGAPVPPPPPPPVTPFNDHQGYSQLQYGNHGGRGDYWGGRGGYRGGRGGW
ncbi:RNA polymerase II-binding domain protein [Seiridium cupressi]